MRSLVLFALSALAALPLAAREHGRGPAHGPLVPASRPVYRYEARERWEPREHRAWGYLARQDWDRRHSRRIYGYGCEEDRLLVRPGWMAAPSGLVIRIH